MDFLTLPIHEADGCILTHAVTAGGGTMRKGTQLGAEELARLKASGVLSVPVVRLAVGDVIENEAARQLADAIRGTGVAVRAPFTGRVNLHADHAGLLLLDENALLRFNSFDESVTVASLANFKRVDVGEMVATVKIIPFAIPDALITQVRGTVSACVSVRPFRQKRIAVISTMLPHLKAATIAKTLRVLETRIVPSGATIAADIRVAHDKMAVADALQSTESRNADLIILFGASAVTDRRDVIPAGIGAAGGIVDHLGMPVDPGNLLVLGHIGQINVIGAPGCARSPRENGFDWVLDRLLCDIQVTPRDIMRMGVGGLLKEIGTRPQPRDGAEPA